MVIRVRRRLIATARALAEHGTTPPGVDNPEAYRQRSGGVVLDEGADWVEATRDLRQAYAAHPELDPAIVGGFV
jgi:phthalate 4,5-dioxygenase